VNDTLIEKQTYFIRKIERSDKERFVLMWEKYLKFYHSDFNESICENTFNQFFSKDKNISCFVGCDKHHTAIGFLTYIIHWSTWQINPVCYLNDLFVENEYRQAGIAQQLVDKLITVAKIEHWSKIYWLTKPDNQIARKFYDKMAQGDEWIRYSINLL
jgi:ribosomal protein S18 acetylase RimI-like enzyme